MSTTAFEKLNALQKRAARLSAEGMSDAAIKDALVLPIPLWTEWRSDQTFCDAVAELKAQDTTPPKPADDDTSSAAVDAAINELAQ